MSLLHYDKFLISRELVTFAYNTFRYGQEYVDRVQAHIFLISKEMTMV